MSSSRGGPVAAHGQAAQLGSGGGGGEAGDDDGPVMLAVVLDMSVTRWAEAARTAHDDAASDAHVAGVAPPPGGGDVGDMLRFGAVVQQLVVFINAFMLLHRDNRVCVVASHPRHTRFLYPPPGSSSSSSSASAAQAQGGGGGGGGDDDDDEDMDGGGGGGAADSAPGASSSAAAARREEDASFADVGEAIVLGVRHLSSAPDASESPEPPSRLSGALSMALAYAARARRDERRMTSRVFVLTASPDDPSQYVAAMNCVFAAQNGGVAVDSLVVGREHSLVLQQAAHLTSGVYSRCRDGGALLQLLLGVYTAGAACRRHLRMPQLGSVNNCASCFCHNVTVDTGFVCPVCLSIFCRPTFACATCGMRFPELANARKKAQQ